MGQGGEEGELVARLISHLEIKQFRTNYVDNPIWLESILNRISSFLFSLSAQSHSLSLGIYKPIR